MSSLLEKLVHNIIVFLSHIRWAAKRSFRVFASPWTFFGLLKYTPPPLPKKKQVDLDSRPKGLCSCIVELINLYIFPDVPAHYPIHKKLSLLKSRSVWGKAWDIWLLLLSLLACGVYVSQTYLATYNAVQLYSVIELVFTEFFALDLIYNFFCASNIIIFFASSWTVIDILTVLPVFITYGAGDGSASVNLAVFRVVRILRLLRILRVLKILGSMNGLHRQFLQFTLTVLTMVFLEAGIVQLFYDDVTQALQYDCNYIGSGTGWEPSCDPNIPALEIDNCDCDKYSCESFYSGFDPLYQPSGVRCVKLTFFDAVYFMIVTMATVGYGDVQANSTPTRSIIMLVIATNLILIPIQVNQLVEALSASSSYTKPFATTVGEEHIILCGHVGDLQKLERFLKEFYNPDRAGGGDRDIRVLILSPAEPSNELKQMMTSGIFEGRLHYLIGTALSSIDLDKARADMAAGVLFLCNRVVEGGEDGAKLDDAANLLRALSVTNFNARAECLVQVLRPDDRDVLRGCNAGVVICLDELRTTLQARNAVIPGITALIENLFTTTSYPPDDGMFNDVQWMREYVSGASIEAYVVPISFDFMSAMRFDFSLIAEGIYLEFGVMAIGLFNNITNELVLNPTKLEIYGSKSRASYFQGFNQVILLCNGMLSAENVSNGLEDRVIAKQIRQKLAVAESSFNVRKPLYNRSGDAAAVPAAAAGVPAAEAVGDASLFDRDSGKSSSPVSSHVPFLVPVTPQASNPGGIPPTPGSTQSPENDNWLIRRGVRFEGRLETPSPSAKTRPTIPNGAPGVVEASHHTAALLHTDANGVAIKVGRALRGSVLFRTTLDLDKVVQVGGDSEAVENREDQGQRLDLENFNAADIDQIVSFRQVIGYASRREEISEKWNPTNPSNPHCGLAVENNVHGGESYLKLSKEERKFAAKSKSALKLEERDNVITSANSLSSHIIVFGDVENIECFIAELRRPLVMQANYHPILILGSKMPDYWLFLQKEYTDLYFLHCDAFAHAQLVLANFKDAHSVVILAQRDNIQKFENENLDYETMYACLKLGQYIPAHVFFSVELISDNDVPVLNAIAMRRAKHHQSASEEASPPSTGGLDERDDDPSPPRDTQLFPSLSSRKMMLNVPKKGADMEVTVALRAAHQNRIHGGLALHHGGKRRSSSVLCGLGMSSARLASSSAEDLVPGGTNKGKAAAVLIEELKSLTRRANQLELQRNTEERNKTLDKIASIEASIKNHHNVGLTGGSKFREEHVGEDGTGDSFSMANLNVKKNYWTILGQSVALPVFASGKAFVPNVFDSLMSFSFFDAAHPILCERLICGQKYQTMFQIDVPAAFVGRCFIDAYRSFMSRGVMIIAILRGPNPEVKALLPYVVTAPVPDALLESTDRLFVYCNPVELWIALERGLSSPLIKPSPYKCGLSDRLFEMEATKESMSREAYAGEDSARVS